MPAKLTEDAVEKSTFAIEASFFDEDDNPVTPNNVAWTLTNSTGDVINSRDDETITPGTSVTIVLSGDDLALQTGESGAVTRIVTIVADYDSSLGSALPLTDECTFTLLDLKYVT